MTERIVVTVDGLDGSGKSTLARALAERLGPRAVALAVDDFRQPVTWVQPGRSELDVYYEDRYDFAALGRAVDAFLAGAPGHPIPIFDSVSETVTGQAERDFESADHLIVEGVFVARLARPVVSIWVDVDPDEARRRILLRDRQKGRSEAEVLHRIESRYFPAHARYLAGHAPHDRAEIVVAGGKIARGTRDPRNTAIWEALATLG
jgi:uridine kinase